MGFSALKMYASLCSLNVDSVQLEEQNSDYESGKAQLSGTNTEVSGTWRVRTARVTPTKPGAFVAVWKRDYVGETQPFSFEPEVQGLLVFVSEQEKFGVFQFTQEHLAELKVLSTESSPGKRGFRVYPSWCTDLNAQATRSQRLQAKAFTQLR